MPNQMAMKFFGNSKTLPFVGMKSDFNHLLNFIGVLDFKNTVFTGTNFEPIKNALNKNPTVLRPFSLMLYK